MLALPAISLSGMNAAQTRLDVVGHNVANVDTPNFRRQQVVQTADAGGGVNTSITQAGASGSALEADLVDQLQAKNSFLANLAVFRTGNQMLGALLDVSA